MPNKKAGRLARPFLLVLEKWRNHFNVSPRRQNLAEVEALCALE
jgi:hypothetical protein